MFEEMYIDEDKEEMVEVVDYEDGVYKSDWLIYFSQLNLGKRL